MTRTSLRHPITYRSVTEKRTPRRIRKPDDKLSVSSGSSTQSGASVLSLRLTPVKVNKRLELVNKNLRRVKRMGSSRVSALLKANSQLTRGSDAERMQRLVKCVKEGCVPRCTVCNSHSLKFNRVQLQYECTNAISMNSCGARFFSHEV